MGRAVCGGGMLWREMSWGVVMGRVVPWARSHGSEFQWPGFDGRVFQEPVVSFVIVAVAVAVNDFVVVPIAKELKLYKQQSLQLNIFIFFKMFFILMKNFFTSVPVTVPVLVPVLAVVLVLVHVLFHVHVHVHVHVNVHVHRAHFTPISPRQQRHLAFISEINVQLLYLPGLKNVVFGGEPVKSL